MQNDRVHPLLQQVPLAVNPFIDLPKPPTLPHNYISIPSTLPPSILNVPPTTTHPDLPAYVTATSGFSAHPSVIAAQNQALLDSLEVQRKRGAEEVEEWERGIKERDLAEKRRKAPGWLDSEARMLEPEKPKVEMGAGESLMDDVGREKEVGSGETRVMVPVRKEEVDDLGAAMDRAFG